MPEPASWFDLKLTEQLPDERVQDAGLNDPRPVFDALKVILPVGVMVFCVAIFPTEAVHVVELPCMKDDGLHVTEVTVCPEILSVSKTLIVPLMAL